MAPRSTQPSLRASSKDDGILLPVRLSPKARKNAITGIAEDADGTRRLKVSVTAAPEAGKANAALVDLLAKRWNLPKSAFSITAGATSRAKTLLIKGTADSLLAVLNRETVKP